jgi:hypothetical protein
LAAGYYRIGLHEEALRLITEVLAQDRRGATVAARRLTAFAAPQGQDGWGDDD